MRAKSPQLRYRPKESSSRKTAEIERNAPEVIARMRHAQN
jgi:hypothetical protein